MPLQDWLGAEANMTVAKREQLREPCFAKLKEIGELGEGPSDAKRR